MANLIIMSAKAVTRIRNELQFIAVTNWMSEWWGMLRLWESFASCCAGLENFNHIYIGYSWDQSLFNSVSKVQSDMERVKFQHEVWTMWYVPNEHWQKYISIRKCAVLKETAVDRTKNFWFILFCFVFSGECHSHGLFTILCMIFCHFCMIFCH